MSIFYGDGSNSKAEAPEEEGSWTDSAGRTQGRKLDDNKTYTMLILSGLSKLAMKEIESMHLSSETWV